MSAEIISVANHVAKGRAHSLPDPKNAKAEASASTFVAALGSG
jgi:hypothetical protein